MGHTYMGHTYIGLAMASLFEPTDEVRLAIDNLWAQARGRRVVGIQVRWGKVAEDYWP